MLLINFRSTIAVMLLINVGSTIASILLITVRRGARWPSGLERWLEMATGHSQPGSNPTSVKTFHFGGTLAVPFTSLSDETPKAVGPFYLVSMSGEVKDPTSPHWNV